MIIKRQQYLDRLINRRCNGLVKVVTGLRRCGKSFLLFTLYHEYLNGIGVSDDHIVEVALDAAENFIYHNPRRLLKHLKSRIVDKEQYYIFIDEIQFVKKIKIRDPEIGDSAPITFYSVVNALLKLPNADVYVTGSNSTMLSKDVMTEFRGRGDEVRVRPLSFLEFMSVYEGDARDGWDEYLEYGGMPLAVLAKGHEAKSNYLKNLFEETYLKDVVERYKIRKPDVLGDVVDVLASGVGSLTNPQKLANSFRTIKKASILAKTVDGYIGKLKNSFLLEGVRRYDVKGRKYIGALRKYYFADTGLRNARIGFRQTEVTHLMENAICTELLSLGYDVDVGIVEIFETSAKGSGVKKQIEIDFVANKADRRYYIQSALTIDDPLKRAQEIRPFDKVGDSFKKIILVGGRHEPRRDENGYLVAGVIDFMLSPETVLS